MTSQFRRRRFIGAIVLATLGSSAGLSQTRPRVTDPLPPRNLEMENPRVIDGIRRSTQIVVPCCKCVDGSKQQISIDTNGSNPWMVSSMIPGLSGPWPIFAGALTNPHPAWASSTAALAPAKWIQPSTSTMMGNFNNGRSVFTLSIRVPRCTVPMNVRINGQFAGDDSASASIDGGPATPPVGFGGGLGTISGDISAPGVHTLRVVVQNIGGGPTGMILRGMITKLCSNQIEQGGRSDMQGEPQE